MDEIWAWDILSLFSGWFLHALSVIIIFSVFSVTYLCFVTFFSFVRREGWRDTESKCRRATIDGIIYSPVGDALSSLFQTLAFVASSIIRLIALPFRLFASLSIRFILGPVERLLDKSEKAIDERSESEFERMRDQAERGLQRQIRRELHRARKQKMKQEIALSRQELRLPDFTGIQRSSTNDEIAKEILLERRIAKCVEGLKSGELPNPAIKEVAKFLQSSEADARRVRNKLHERGYVIRHANGTMEFSHLDDKGKA